MESAQDLLLEEIRDFLVMVAHKAGDMILAAHPSTGKMDLKKNSVDLVTETDKAVETMISTTILHKFPSYAFMGEETYKPGDTLTSEPTFIVDPIDGTTNFIHTHPYVSVSLGFAINRIPTVGVVYNPFSKTLYTAIKGQGAFMNQTIPLPLRNPPEPLQDLSNCLVAVEWGSDRSGPDYDVKTSTFAKLCASKEQGGAMVHSLRSLGSAALNFCQVAAGTLDIYWEAGCWAWDVCAGWVILTEAGGMVVDANPGNWEARVDGRRYLAVRGASDQKKVIEEFWGVIVGKYEMGKEIYGH
ncbi:inositol monophosphatase [Venturia nashicola]|uniref:Inositol-1-monophosphatase n=1 Tax=Venturia nashicola TaxID=86259 RepID=A0A4Z1PR07_9PEZI|nr:inositol monophosphatase [Venturia nashicola]TLD37611.1 inositol monophosphatase [Venturia nashicola]